MANWNKEEIAGMVRIILRTKKYGYETDGDYVRKPITDNFGIGFYHDDDSTLCLCVYHKEGAQFSPKQRKVIMDVLAREEFTASYYDVEESESADGKAEIWAPLRIDAFEGWSQEEIADWIARLFGHFVTTVELLL